MKKNPLFISKSGANKQKIKHAKTILGFSLFLLGMIAFMIIASVPSHGLAAAGTVLGFLPLIAGVKGTKAANGVDETDEEFAARKGKAEDDAVFIKRYMSAQIAEAITKAKTETNADLTAKLTAIEAQIKAAGSDKEVVDLLKAEMRNMGLKLTALSENAKVGRDRSVKEGSIAETLLKNREKIDAFVKQKSGNLEIMHKSHATDTSTDIANRNYYESAWHEGGQSGLLAVRQPFLKELFKNQSAASEFIKYRDQATAVRTAANVALCATSNTTSKLTWATNTMQITKIRDYVDVCLDMMNDYSFVSGEIKNLIDSSVQLKVDDQLLVGSGTHPETNSLSSISSTWAANIAGTKDWSNAVSLANLIDLIVVVKSQIMELGKWNKFMPNVVVLNPGDWTSILLIKNSFGDGIKPNPALGVDMFGNITIAGMRVIANPNVTVNTMWVGDFTKGTVYNIPGVGIELSYENATNFETETVTVKAYERLNLLVRTVDTNAFMSVPAIDTALAAITKP